jgi:hypothetical protein
VKLFPSTTDERLRYACRTLEIVTAVLLCFIFTANWHGPVSPAFIDGLMGAWWLCLGAEVALTVALFWRKQSEHAFGLLVFIFVMTLVIYPTLAIMQGRH